MTSLLTTLRKFLSGFAIFKNETKGLKVCILEKIRIFELVKMKEFMSIFVENFGILEVHDLKLLFIIYNFSKEQMKFLKVAAIE